MKRTIATLAALAAFTLPTAAYAKGDTVPLNPHFANQCPTSIVWDATVGTVPNQAIAVILDRNTLTRSWTPATTAGVYHGRFDNLSITGGSHQAVISLYQSGRVVEHHDIDIIGTHDCGL